MSRLSPRAAIWSRLKTRKRPSSPDFSACASIGFGAVTRLEVGKVFPSEWSPFAESWHVGSQVVNPNCFVLPVSVLPRVKNRTFVFDSLCVKDARRKSQNCVQIALVHQVGRIRLPVPSSNSTLSGNTTAARPPGLRAR